MPKKRTEEQIDADIARVRKALSENSTGIHAKSLRYSLRLFTLEKTGLLNEQRYAKETGPRITISSDLFQIFLSKKITLSYIIFDALYKSWDRKYFVLQKKDNKVNEDKYDEFAGVAVQFEASLLLISSYISTLSSPNKDTKIKEIKENLIEEISSTEKNIKALKESGILEESAVQFLEVVEKLCALAKEENYEFPTSITLVIAQSSSNVKKKKSSLSLFGASSTSYSSESTASTTATSTSSLSWSPTPLPTTVSPSSTQVVLMPKKTDKQPKQKTGSCVASIQSSP